MGDALAFRTLEVKLSIQVVGPFYLEEALEEVGMGMEEDRR